MRNTVTVPLFAVVVCVVCCVAATLRAADPIRIGVCLSLTGETSEVGVKGLAGVKIRAGEWNRANRDKPIELVIRDDRSLKDVALEAMRELVEEEGVSAIIGPATAKLLLHVRDYARERKVVVVSPNDTTPFVSRDNDWTFRLHFDDGFQCQALAQFLHDKLKLRRVAGVVNENYPYPASAFHAFSRRFLHLGGEVAAAARYGREFSEDEDEGDYRDVMRTLASSKPEMVFLPLHAREAAALLRAARRYGLRSKFCGADSWESEVLLLSGGNSLEGAYYVGGMNLQSKSAEMRHFLGMFDNSNELGAEPASVYGYDCLSLVLEAMRGGTDSESVRSGLYSLKNHRLATGPITIDRQRGTLRPAYIHRVVLGGDEFRSEHVDTVWPEGLADE